MVTHRSLPSSDPAAIEAPCPECGDPVIHRTGWKGRVPTYCSRRCQVRNLNRRRYPRKLSVPVDQAAIEILAPAAALQGVSLESYLAQLVSDHAARLRRHPARLD